MKWYKHMTTASDDLFVKDLERKFGDSGYAFWFKTLELIGAHGDAGKLTISWDNYSERLHKRWVKVEELLNFCSSSGKLLVTMRENEVTIECQKFAEYSDNYTKYGQGLQSGLKVPAKQEVEEEVDKEKEKTTMVVSDFSDMEQYLLQEWGREGRVGWSIITDFIDLGKKYSKEKLFEAIKTAAHANIKNFRYVKGILNGGGNKNGGIHRVNEMPFEKHDASDTVLNYICKNGHDNKMLRSQWQKNANRQAKCSMPMCDERFSVNDVLKQIPEIKDFNPYREI